MSLRHVAKDYEYIGKGWCDDILFAVVTGLGVRVEYPPPSLQLGFLYRHYALDGRDCCGEFLMVWSWFVVRAIVTMQRREEAG